MSSENLVFTLASAIACMTLVAVVSYWKTRGTTHSKDGYFLAGRGLTGTFIAGSLLLTNLSAEQLIGLNGSAYGFNMTAMAWEVTAGFAIIIMALFFLPKYLSGAFTTLPQFLEQRFDPGVRRLSALLFLLGYGLITIPSVLYAGSLAVLKLFDVPGLFNVSQQTGLLLTVLSIGSIGGIYAVFGGLRAVAISDTLNGVGLLIIGALVPLLGLSALGNGSIVEGWQYVLSHEPEKLNAIGSTTDPVPFATLFTGMILANLFYWGTNQYVIQRTLGAKSLAEGQKGVLLSGFFKLLIPFFMMLPGVIAYHLFGPELSGIDLAYPTLVATVLPTYLAGFFLAVLLGAVFSSFNSLLNSAATLFCLDIYQPLTKRRLTDAQLVTTAKVVSVIIALFSFIAAPLLQYAPEGLWQVIRVFTGFYNIPIITLVVVGLFTKLVPPLAAKVAVVFHIVAYGCLQFVFATGIHFIHLYAVLFIVECLIMLTIGHFQPMTRAWQQDQSAVVDMTPWKHAHFAAGTLILGIVLIYFLFSSAGIAASVPVL